MSEPPAFGDFLVFVDESGDHSLTSINPEHPVFVLAFVIIAKTAYVGEVCRVSSTSSCVTGAMTRSCSMNTRFGNRAERSRF